MSTFRIYVAVLSLASLTASGARTDDAVAKFDGTWVVTSLNIEGNERLLEGIVVKSVFKVGKYQYIWDGEEIETGSFKTDATKQPATIDFAIATGEHKGREQFGIFKLEGDTLTFAAFPRRD